MYADIKKFHESTTKELIALKDRVRNLIGGQNWGDEGRYKEVVLKNVIRRFLPNEYNLGSGFVVKKNGTNYEISKQIDLIIYDRTLPILFAEGDFIITTPASVMGIIEVKTNSNNVNMSDEIVRANEMGGFICKGRRVITPLFNAIFCFEGYEERNTDAIKENLRSECQGSNRSKSRYIVNHLCLNKNLFIKYWNDTRKEYILYGMQDLAFSYFISNIVYHVTQSKIKMENDYRIWFPEQKWTREIWHLNI